MRLLVLACAITLAGCGHRSDPPLVAGPLKASPSGTHAVSAPMETFIATHANAVATHDKAAEKAAIVGQDDQRHAEINAELARFYVLAVLAFIVAGALAYKGSYSLSGTVGCVAVCAAVGPTLVSRLLLHEEAVTVSVLITALGALVWHYRAKEAAWIEKERTRLALATVHVQQVPVLTPAPAAEKAP